MNLSLCEFFPAFHLIPNAIAVQEDNTPITFKTLYTLIEERAKKWKTRGLTTETRVAFSATTSLDCLLDILAVWHLGGTVCPLNPHLPRPGRDNLLQRLAPVIFWDGSRVISFQGENKLSLSLATLLCTSGTTATPKIAAHTFDNFLTSAASSAQALQLSPNQSWHLSLPLYHVSGLSILFRCMITGAALILNKNSTFSHATHFSLVPTQVFRILQNPDLRNFYRKAKCLLVGGAPLTHTLYTYALDEGLPLATTWGMTETTATATLALSPTSTLHNGPPLSHIELSLSNQEEIRVRGPSIFVGYLENGVIMDMRDEAGWFYTKDRGTFTTEGHLVWLGRKDLMFISGGENIQPEEIEQALSQIPGITEAIVVSIEDWEFGSLPVAFIRTTFSTFDEMHLRKALENFLPRFKIPRYFFSFPESTKEMGKTNRQAFQVQAAKLCGIRGNKTQVSKVT